VYNIMTNDFALPKWAVSNGGSSAQLAGYPLRRDGLMEAAPKAALFEKTMLRHLDAAYNLARWLTRNEHDAEDIVHATYMRAFRFFDGFRGGDGRPWLLAVVRNAALTWLRREDRSSRCLSMKKSTVAVPRPRQSRLIWSNAPDFFPLSSAKFVVMRDVEEMSYRDIAEAASAPIGTVMRLSRARQRLQDCVAVRMKETSK